MNYKNYITVRDAAWQILIDSKTHSPPVKVVQICKNMGIQVKLYESPELDDGYCKMYPNEPFIFVNARCSRERQRFTIAHELGHIVLGHVGKFPLINREPSPNDNQVETEANTFAFRLLAPACVFHELGINNAYDIARICGISLQSARFRYERLKLLRGRNRFYTSDLEWQVYMQFKDWVDANKL